MKRDHAGVYIPPPLIYAAIFFGAWFIQKNIPLNNSFLEKEGIKFIGILFFLAATYLMLRGVGKFLISGNTLVTMKPANSLQQEGIYKFTRNPMYLGFVLFYLGFTCFFGNW